jgi:hypothetical protein
MRRSRHLRVPCLATSAVLGLVSGACAQDESATPRLVELGRAFARGDGAVARCLIRPDSAHMLTVGSDGDLVWWDLAKRRPLQWLPPPDVPVHSVFLHTQQPSAVCVLADESALRIDLELGTRSTWTKEQAQSLSQPGAGDWLTGGHAGPAGTAASANGKYRVEGGQRLPDGPARRFGTCWLANDGTVIEALVNSVRIAGDTHRDCVDVAVHAGPPQELVFTPDGNQLAIPSLGALQVVDFAGNEVARFEGPHLARPGAAGDEFWVLTEHTMVRWNATRRARVGDTLAWPGKSLRLVDDVADLRPRLRPVLVRNGQPWTSEAVRLPDGSFRRVEFAPPPPPTPANGLEAWAFLDPERCTALVAASDRTPPLLLTSARERSKFAAVRATLRRLGDDGATTHHVRFTGVALWLLLADDGTRAIVGLADGTVQSFATTDLTLLATGKVEPAFRHAIAFGPRHLLGTDGEKLLRLDATTFAVAGELPLPRGLSGIDRLASSADGRRVAVARGCEVRILRVD